MRHLFVRQFTDFFIAFPLHEKSDGSLMQGLYAFEKRKTGGYVACIFISQRLDVSDPISTPNTPVRP